MQAYVENEVITVCKEKIKKYEIPNKILLIEVRTTIRLPLIKSGLGVPGVPHRPAACVLSRELNVCYLRPLVYGVCRRRSAWTTRC